MDYNNEKTVEKLASVGHAATAILNAMELNGVAYDLIEPMLKALVERKQKETKKPSGMTETTLEAIKKGEFFKFSPTGKVYEKESGGKVLHKYCPVDDFCDQKETKNGKRKVFIDFEY